MSIFESRIEWKPGNNKSSHSKETYSIVAKIHDTKGPGKPKIRECNPESVKHITQNGGHDAVMFYESNTKDEISQQVNNLNDF